MGRKNRRKTNSRMKITTKTAISKSELRAARKREESEIKEAVSSKRNLQNQQKSNSKEEANMVAHVTDPVSGAQVNKTEIVEHFKDKWNIAQIADYYEIDDEKVISILVCNAYEDEELTILDCAAKFDLTQYRVRKILADNKIQMRHRGFQSGITKPKEQDNKEVENTPEIKVTKVEEAKPEAEDPKNKLNKNTFEFCEQKYTNDKLYRLEFDKFSQDIVVAGLCRNRHDMPVSKYIFDTLGEKEIEDPKYVESRALGFINAYVRPKPTMPAKTLVLYCTGFALALSTVVKICVQSKVNLLTMHWNPHTESYTPQVTLDIFGKVPSIDEISPLKSLENKYKGGVYLYGCKMKNLVEQERCTFVSLHDDYHPERNVIIFFSREYPTDKIWKFYSEMIKISRNDGFAKRQNIQLGQINVSLSGYNWGDVLSKSYNWRDDRPKTTNIIR